MGNYTGLRFRGYVKPEYRQMIQEIMDSTVDWKERKRWEDFTDQFPFLADFAELERSSMIPFGAYAYMPDKWEDEDDILTSSFENRFNMETGYWAFGCSLKNYDSEIDVFLRDVIPVICTHTEHIEYLYEEWHASRLYKLEEGKLVNAGEIKYIDDDGYELETRWGY